MIIFTTPLVCSSFCRHFLRDAKSQIYIYICIYMLFCLQNLNSGKSPNINRFPDFFIIKLWGHSFSTFAKFSKNLDSLPSLLLLPGQAKEDFQVPSTLIQSHVQPQQKDLFHPRKNLSFQSDLFKICNT